MEHALQDRQQESRRLTGPGVSQTDNVLAFEHVRDRPVLDRGRGHVAVRLDIKLQAIIEFEIDELVLRLVYHLF